MLDYNSGYMFRPNFRAIFRLIVEQVECTVDNASYLRDLVFQELVKLIVVFYRKDLSLNLICIYEYISSPSLHTRTLM